MPLGIFWQALLMQLRAALGVWIILTGTASARSAGADGRASVAICMERPGDSVLTISQAQVITSVMFEGIGVAIVWHEWNRCPLELHPILISLSTHTPEKYFPKSLAYSQPFEGVHIRVFYDRVRSAEQLCPIPALLAHVLAHEIGHMLQRSDQHVPAGVMKRRWDGRDYVQMARRPLPFSEVDIELIHRGLESRAGQPNSSVEAALSR